MKYINAVNGELIRIFKSFTIFFAFTFLSKSGLCLFTRKFFLKFSCKEGKKEKELGELLLRESLSLREF